MATNNYIDVGPIQHDDLDVGVSQHQDTGGGGPTVQIKSSTILTFFTFLFLFVLVHFLED